IDGLDAPFFGLTPQEASSLDPQQRLVLEVGWEALEDAGLPATRLAGSATGVYLGISSNDYGTRDTLVPETIDAYSRTGSSRAVAANRLSYFLDLRGPSVAIDTSCSSSLVALHLACQSLHTRETDLAVAGGVNVILSPAAGIAVSKSVAMAKDGRCKSFDRRADGIVRGEGCAMIVLKRLSDALADGDRISAVVRGSAVNQDGRSNGLTAPNPDAQVDVIERALSNAALKGHEISYVEAHGAGTPVGDSVEVHALKTALGADRATDTPCRIGSLKTNMGHLEAASGIAGVVKTILALTQECIPPHLHLTELNPKVALDATAFEIPREPTPWPAGARHRHAGISAFSVGGTNAHVILSEAPPIPAISPREAQVLDGVCLLPLSAAQPEALRARAKSYGEFLTRNDWQPASWLRELSYSASCRRTHHSRRAAVSANHLSRFEKHYIVSTTNSRVPRVIAPRAVRWRSSSVGPAQYRRPLRRPSVNAPQCFATR
ncbi:MAG: polyketide synthase, partial [Pseudomonadota bacterium]